MEATYQMLQGHSGGCWLSPSATATAWQSGGKAAQDAKTGFPFFKHIWFDRLLNLLLAVHTIPLMPPQRVSI